MTSNINEIVAPVIGQLRNSSSSAVTKPIARGSSADLVQENAVVKPSPGKHNRVEQENKNDKPSRELIEKTLVRANELARYLSRKLNFSYDDRIEKIIVRVVEGDSEKVIRQIPPEEMIRLSLRMDEIMGMLFNQNV